ncbi:MAG TPA: cytochrome P450 [Phycisphaerae bacterium]|nr:cytochrome P450 [Phycisphaerae bacterium]
MIGSTMAPLYRKSKITAPLPPGPRSLLPAKTFLHLRRDPLAFISHLTRTFGDISSFSALGQRYIILNHPDLARDVLLTQADAFFKGPALQNSRHLLGDGLLTAEGDTHKSQRRLMTPAFHAKRVETYAPDILACTQRTIQELAAAQSPVDIRDFMTRLTLRIAVQTLFGIDAAGLNAADTDLVGRSMHTLMSNYIRTVVPWGKLLNALPLPSTRRIKKARTDLFALIDRLIANRRTQSASPGTPYADLLSTLIAATDTECPHAAKAAVRLTDQQLRDQAITLLTAGHETTANAFTFTLYLLATHPDEQQKLADEIRSVLADRPPTVADLHALPYTHNVIAESLRLYPPAWTLGRQNQRSLTLAGYRIPNRSTLLIPQWTLHRDPRFFPNPLAFTPDRWQNPTHPRHAYLPFSTGPRNCIGESFASLEMQLVLPLLLQHFRFTLSQKSPPLKLHPAITLRPATPILLEATAR